VKTKYSWLALFLALALALGGCTALTAPQQRPQDTDPAKEVREITVILYYGEREALGLVAEERTIVVPRGTEPLQAALSELAKAPNAANAIVMLPAGTEVLDVTVEDGLVTLNFNAALRDNFYGGSFSEALLIDSIVQTVTGMDDYTGCSVQFLINGEKFESIGGHISAEDPFQPGVR
jgi:germination protein M